MLTEIANLYEGIKKKQAIGITTGENVGILDSSSILDDCSHLSGKVADFLAKFKEAHQI